MPQRTVLYPEHEKMNARTVDFGGWEMPVHYGSQVTEHHAVRRDAGMFDVSHMTVVDIAGSGARGFLRHLLANDVDRLKIAGKALYSCMLNERGGIVDDLITYFLGEGDYRLVVNAATRDKDLAWIGARAEGHDVSVTERPELAMIAVQGPNARAKAAGVLDAAHRDQALALKPFHAARLGELFVARTGYTGEDGWEIVLPGEAAPALWEALHAAGIAPCGLGARDTLRLEAGMNLYGQDMTEDTTPLESGLTWTVAFDPADRAFVGRDALERQRAEGCASTFVGLLLEGRGVLRPHQPVIVDSGGEGEVTSGTYSPTLERSVGMARVPAGIGDRCEVDIRGRRVPASVHALPFVRAGKVRIDL